MLRHFDAENANFDREIALKSKRIENPGADVVERHWPITPAKWRRKLAAP